MKCKHQFFETAKIDPREYIENPMWKEGDNLLMKTVETYSGNGPGVIVTCAMCDEKRHVYCYGDMKIISPNSKPKSL